MSYEERTLIFVSDFDTFKCDEEIEEFVVDTKQNMHKTTEKQEQKYFVHCCTYKYTLNSTYMDILR